MENQLTLWICDDRRRLRKPLSRCICCSDILVRFACDLFQPWTLIGDCVDSFPYFEEKELVFRNTMVSLPVDKRTTTAPTCLLQNFAVVDQDKQMSEARTFSIIVIGVALLIGSIECGSVSRANTIYLYYIIYTKYIRMCAFLRQYVHL